MVLLVRFSSSRVFLEVRVLLYFGVRGFCGFLCVMYKYVDIECFWMVIVFKGS